MVFRTLFMTISTTCCATLGLCRDVEINCCMNCVICTSCCITNPNNTTPHTYSTKMIHIVSETQPLCKNSNSTSFERISLTKRSQLWAALTSQQIGRASSRERMCQDG